MAHPTRTITSPLAAAAAARAVETPSEVAAFMDLAVESPSVRAFLQTPEWAAIHERIMGDGSPPMGHIGSLAELSRLMRWSADSVFAEQMLTPEARAAYLHAAAEIDAYAKRHAVVDELAARRAADAA